MKILNQQMRDSGQRKKWEQSESGKECIEKSKLKRMYKKHNISKKQWKQCKEYFGNTCAYCGLAIEEHWIQFKGKIQLGDFHKEHVDDEGNNDLSNCIPSCKLCNSSKHQYQFEEWYPKQEFYSEERLDKIYQWLNQDYKNFL